jgi:hypothetical protein
MASTEDPTRRREIQLGLKSIVESSERLLANLRKREWRVRVASSFLTTILAFAILAVSTLILLFTQGQLKTFGPPPHQFFPLLALSGLIALASGVLTYFFLKRKHEAELKDLASLIAQMKKENETNGVGSTENALSLADKILAILPELVRKRRQDSLLFGVVAFILSAAIIRFPPVALLIGVIVWLYFRHENRKIYDQEISRLQEQKRVFDQRKKDFLETL